jgi:hypothetical protein
VCARARVRVCFVLWTGVVSASSLLARVIFHPGVSYKHVQFVFFRPDLSHRWIILFYLIGRLSIKVVLGWGLAIP